MNHADLGSTESPVIEALEANPFGYGTQVWSLFRTAPGAGAFPDDLPGVVTGQAGTPAARSVLRVQLRFEGERVADARFKAYGCPTSIAVGAWIAAWARGKSAAELARLDVRALRDALEIPDDRAHGAMLGEDAMRAALARLKPEAKP